MCLNNLGIYLDFDHLHYISSIIAVYEIKDVVIIFSCDDMTFPWTFPLGLERFSLRLSFIG